MIAVGHFDYFPHFRFLARLLFGLAVAGKSS